MNMPQIPDADEQHVSEVLSGEERPQDQLSSDTTPPASVRIPPVHQHRHRKPTVSSFPLGKLRMLFFLFLGLCGCGVLASTGTTHPSVSSVSTQRVGSGGTRNVAINNPPLCGKPIDVFVHVVASSLASGDTPTEADKEAARKQLKQEGLPPGKDELSKLPRPDPSHPHKELAPAEATYDPNKDELCIGGALALDTRYFHPQHNVQGSTNYAPDTSPFDWIWNPLKWIGRHILQGIASFLSLPLAWVKSWGFILRTPEDLTYSHTIVIDLHAWTQGCADAAFVLLVVIAGYNYLGGRSQSLREVVPRLLFAGIAANFSLFFLQQGIDLHNALCDNLVQHVATLGNVKLDLPWGTADASKDSLYTVLAYLAEVIIMILLSLQMLVRIALLDLLIIISPLALLCLALPQTESWARLWVQLFVATLLVQFLQVLCIAMGSALIGNIRGEGFSLVDVFVGIATLFLAFQLPGVLSYPLGRSMGMASWRAFSPGSSGGTNSGSEAAADFASA